jgi:hypothetical protein
LVSFIEPETEPSPLRRGLLAAELLASAVLARWRAIILLFVLFFTIWLAIQVLVAARDAYSYLRDHLPKFSDSSKLLPSIPSLPRGSITISPPPITQCWRDRSLAGDCFKQAKPGSKSPPSGRQAPRP